MLCYKNTYRVNNPWTEKSNLLYDGFSFFKKHMRHRKLQMKENSLRLCILRRSEAWKPLTRILKGQSPLFFKVLVLTYKSYKASLFFSLFCK